MSKQNVIQSLSNAEDAVLARHSPLFPQLVLQSVSLQIICFAKAILLLPDCITQYPTASFLEYARKGDDGRIIDSYAHHLGILHQALGIIVVVCLLFGLSTVVVLASASF